MSCRYQYRMAYGTPAYVARKPAGNTVDLETVACAGVDERTHTRTLQETEGVLARCLHGPVCAIDLSS